MLFKLRGNVAKLCQFQGWLFKFLIKEQRKPMPDILARSCFVSVFVQLLGAECSKTVSMLNSVVKVL